MKRRSAHTLIEVVIVCGLVALLIGLVVVSWMMLNRTSRMQISRIDARQQVRTSMAVLRANLQSARYVFVGYDGMFANRHYKVPATSAGSVPAQGDLLFALPANAAATNMLWKIVGMAVVPRIPADPNNPNALDILVQTVDNVGPVVRDDPQELQTQLPSLGPAGTRRFEAYIEPGSYGIIIRPAPVSIFMRFTFKLRPTDVAVGSASYSQTESYESEVFLRNQPAMDS